MSFIFCIAINTTTLKFPLQVHNRDERMVKEGIEKGRKLCVESANYQLASFFCFFSFWPFGAGTPRAHHEVYRRD